MRLHLLASALLLLLVPAPAQLARRADFGADMATTPAHRTRLYLKNGSYQLVLGYTIKGGNVRYTSAERGGQMEDIPLSLVDLPATERWARDHAAAAASPGSSEAQRAPVIDPELAREEAERAAMTPEVAPNLRLPAENSVLVRDTFHDLPELIPVLQTDGQMTRGQTHNVLKAIVNPRASMHSVVVLKGERAPVQLHENQPIFYIHLDDDLPGGGSALTVDTHGASAAASRERKPDAHEYVISRVDVRQDARVVSSFNPALLGSGRSQQDTFETNAVPLAGGHWLEVRAREPLLIGEYALVEVLGEREINLGVWDFGIHPTAPENRDAIRPEERRRNLELERRELERHRP